MYNTAHPAKTKRFLVQGQMQHRSLESLEREVNQDIAQALKTLAFGRYVLLDDGRAIIRTA